MIILSMIRGRSGEKIQKEMLNGIGTTDELEDTTMTMRPLQAKRTESIPKPVLGRT
jgi:hypothetical protein